MQSVKIKGRRSDGKPQSIAIDDSGRIMHGPTTTTLGMGRQTCTPVNTQIQLYSTPTTCGWVIIQTGRNNGGYVAVGTTPGVSATPGAEYGVVLDSSESVKIDVDDLSEVWISGTIVNDTINYLYGV